MRVEREREREGMEGLAARSQEEPKPKQLRIICNNILRLGKRGKLRLKIIININALGKMLICLS